MHPDQLRCIDSSWKSLSERANECRNEVSTKRSVIRHIEMPQFRLLHLFKINNVTQIPLLILLTISGRLI